MHKSEIVFRGLDDDNAKKLDGILVMSEKQLLQFILKDDRKYNLVMGNIEALEYDWAFHMLNLGPDDDWHYPNKQCEWWPRYAQWWSWITNYQTAEIQQGIIIGSLKYHSGDISRDPRHVLMYMTGVMRHLKQERLNNEKTGQGDGIG